MCTWEEVVQYIGEYHDTSGDIMNTLGDIMMHLGSKLIKAFQFLLKTPMYS